MTWRRISMPSPSGSRTSVSTRSSARLGEHARRPRRGCRRCDVVALLLSRIASSSRIDCSSSTIRMLRASPKRWPAPILRSPAGPGNAATGTLTPSPHGVGTAGSRTSNSVPASGALRTLMSPPCSRTIRNTIARPRPVPGRRGRPGTARRSASARPARDAAALVAHGEHDVARLRAAATRRGDRRPASPRARCGRGSRTPARSGRGRPGTRAAPRPRSQRDRRGRAETSLPLRSRVTADSTIGRRSTGLVPAAPGCAPGYRKRLSVSESRFDSREMMSSRWPCSSPSAGSPMSTWAEPRIEPRGLRISWASCAAISPTAASFSFVRTSCSRRRMSVRSWNTTGTRPAPPWLASGVTETPSSRCRPSGRA